MIGLALFAAPMAEAAEDVARYAEELAELRAEVARLSDEVDQRREELRSRLRSLAAQRADLEVQIRREEVRLGVLEDAMTRQRELVSAEGTEAEALEPVVREGIELLRASVLASLPYRSEERVAALDELERKLDEGDLSPQKTASRLWQFGEDELRLARENALDRQVVELQGREQLVDVARLGMVALYFRTEDGRYGRAAREDGTWTWRPLEDRRDAELVESLFEALERQIRTGRFELPHLVEGS